MRKGQFQMHNENNVQTTYQQTDEGILLSFCIPTYNRERCVYECVTNILKYPGTEIEVVVSDNASPDNTQKLLETIKDPRFIYSRNQSNIGYEGNYPKVLSLAQGQFCAILSDEDDVLVEHIPYFLEQIRQNPSAGLFFCSVRSPDTSTGYRFNNQTFEAGFDTLKRFRFTLTYMTGVIFNRRELRLDLKDKFYPIMLYAAYIFYNAPTITLSTPLFSTGFRFGFQDPFAMKKNNTYYFEIDGRVNTTFPMMVQFYNILPLTAYQKNFLFAYAVADTIGLIKSVYNKRTDFAALNIPHGGIKDFKYFELKKRLFQKLEELVKWSSPAERFVNLTAVHLLYWPITIKHHTIEFLATHLSSELKQKIKKLLRR